MEYSVVFQYETAREDGSVPVRNDNVNPVKFKLANPSVFQVLPYKSVGPNAMAVIYIWTVRDIAM